MQFLLLILLLPGQIFAKEWTREEILKFVNQSPLYVANHQKEDWVELFAKDAFIEDPVGGFHFEQKKQHISRFWDAFIAHNNIIFDVTNDTIVNLTIIRNATVLATIPEANATVPTPAHLRYDMIEVNGELKVKSLRAYWHMPTVTKETLARGKVGQKIMQVQLKNIMQGLGTSIGLNHFLSATMLGVHNSGKKKILRLFDAYEKREEKPYSRLLEKNAKIFINDRPLTAKQFFDTNHSFHQFEKMISSGNSIAMNVLIDNFPAIIIAEINCGKINKIEIFIQEGHY